MTLIKRLRAEDNDYLDQFWDKQEKAEEAANATQARLEWTVSETKALRDWSSSMTNTYNGLRDSHNVLLTKVTGLEVRCTQPLNSHPNTAPAASNRSTTTGRTPYTEPQTASLDPEPVTPHDEQDFTAYLPPRTNARGRGSTRASRPGYRLVGPSGPTIRPDFTSDMISEAPKGRNDWNRGTRQSHLGRGLHGSYTISNVWFVRGAGRG